MRQHVRVEQYLIHARGVPRVTPYAMNMVKIVLWMHVYRDVGVRMASFWSIAGAEIVSHRASAIVSTKTTRNRVKTFLYIFFLAHYFFGRKP